MAVRMFRNRKGMFFTIVAIMIITILFVSFSPEYASRTGYEESVLDGRYEVANDFVNTLKTGYIPAAVEASSYHALQNLSEHIKDEHNMGRPHPFLTRDSFNESFVNMMLTGSLNPCQTSTFQATSDLKPLLYLLEAIENASYRHLKLNTTFDYDNCQDFNVSIYQNNDTGAFLVGVNLTVNFTVQADNLARWDDSENFSILFSFEGIDDPLYWEHIHLKPGNVFEEDFINKFKEVDVKLWNLERTRTSIGERTYRPAGKNLVDLSGEPNYYAPSFLDRFVDGDNVNREELFGNHDLYQSMGMEDYSACCGIESLINPVEMGITSVTNSYVDWCFFSGSGSECNDNVNNFGDPSPKPIKCLTLGRILSIGGDTPSDGLYDSFRLDELHAGTYNVTAYVESPLTLPAVDASQPGRDYYPACP